jgi:hypothetical protein
MPNWCSNSLVIYAKEETIEWIEKNLHENCGRRWDEPETFKSFFCVIEGEKWNELSISVRTASSKFSTFLELILRKFKNVHFKGYYYIDGGFGGADYEEGTDEVGNRYEFYTPILDPYSEYCEEEYYNVIQEVPQEGELEWDKERLQEPHWFDEEEIPTNEELIEDEVRMNAMDFDEWRDFMYKIGKSLRTLQKKSLNSKL